MFSGATADQPEAEANKPVSRLAELRALRAEKSFDPFAIIIDEIKRKGKGALKVREKVQAAEGLARLELDYEKLEFAKAGGGPGAKSGGRVQVSPDGTVQVDMWGNLDDVSDEQLEKLAQKRAAELGLT
jgi:hypothetical protein